MLSPLDRPNSLEMFRNEFAEPKANPINSVAEPDKLSSYRLLTFYYNYPSVNTKYTHIRFIEFKCLFSHLLKMKVILFT